MQDYNLGEPLQSAYRVAHSTKTALLKVKNDIMTSIHNQKGVFLVVFWTSAPPLTRSPIIFCLTDLRRKLALRTVLSNGSSHFQ